MPQGRSKYRGYAIGVERKGRTWLVSVSPTRADLPILHSYSFEPVVRSETEAVAEAKSRVDRVLAN
jgi:hypothetical protein